MMKSLFLNPYTPPVDYGPSDDAMGWIIGFIVAVFIILFLIGIIALLHSKNKKNLKQLSNDEKRIIKSYRASQNLPNEAPIDIETLSEEEKRLIEEYRKNS